MNKFLVLMSFVLFSYSQTIAQTPISSNLFGQNSWLPTFYVDQNQSPNVTYTGYGKLDSYWKKIEDSKVKVIRIGGKTYNRHQPTLQEYQRLIDSVRKHNMIPVIQVSMGELPVVDNGLNGTAQLYSNGAAAVQLIQSLNSAGEYPSNPYYCEYFIIGNEPNQKTSVGFTPQQVHDFYTTVIPMMRDAQKNLSWQVSNNLKGITIIGPELSFYSDYDYSANPSIQEDYYITKLTTPNGPEDITGKDSQGRPYIDVFSFHSYGFNGVPSRQAVIDKLKTGTGDNLYDNITLLKNKLSISASTHNRPQFDIALTEVNLIDNGAPQYSSDGPTKTGARSFLGGQYYAELLGIAMAQGIDMVNYWSVIEGNPTNLNDQGSNRGFFDVVSDKANPSYFHSQLISEHFLKDFASGSSNTQEVKTIAGLEPAGFYVLILNQNHTPLDYRIGFNNNNPSLPSTVSLKFYLTNYHSSMDSMSYNPATGDTLPRRSTTLLQFDCHGKFLSKLLYTEADAISGDGPHLKQVGNNDIEPQLFVNTSNPIGGTITSNTLYSQDTLYVASDIVLGGNTKLTFKNSIVVMAPGTKIKCTPKSSLEIVNSILFGYDGKKWEGIELIGNYQNGERLLIDNSYIFNAEKAIQAEKIPDLTIKNSVFASGETAIELSRSQAFTITDNIIAGYKTGIKTSRTEPGYESYIKENRFIEILTGVDFENDQHNLLELSCNEFRFKDKAVKSTDTELKDQGTTSEGAGNIFISQKSGLPSDYIDHTGSATKYYFGPSQANEFNYPNVMNIPKIQATSDKLCKTALNHCPPFMTASINENRPSQLGMTVYPNPNQGSFSIRLSQPLKNKSTVYVRDVLGRIVSTSIIETGSQSINVDLSVNGIYLISIEQEGNVITEKVIIE